MSRSAFQSVALRAVLVILVVCAGAVRAQPEPIYAAAERIDDDAGFVYGHAIGPGAGNMRENFSATSWDQGERGVMEFEIGELTLGPGDRVTLYLADNGGTTNRASGFEAFWYVGDGEIDATDFDDEGITSAFGSGNRTITNPADGNFFFSEHDVTEHVSAALRANARWIGFLYVANQQRYYDDTQGPMVTDDPDQRLATTSYLSVERVIRVECRPEVLHAVLAGPVIATSDWCRGGPTTVPYKIANAGSGEVFLDAVQVRPDPPFSAAGVVSIAPLAPGEERTVEVTFAPTRVDGDGLFAGAIVVTPDSPGGRTMACTFLGQSEHAAALEYELDRRSVDFGEVAYTAPVDANVTEAIGVENRNVCGDALMVSGLRLDKTRSFAVVEVEHSAVPSGGASRVHLGFWPSPDAGRTTARLTIELSTPGGVVTTTETMNLVGYSLGTPATYWGWALAVAVLVLLPAAVVVRARYRRHGEQRP